jgi:hypothetical protein
MRALAILLISILLMSVVSPTIADTPLSIRESIASRYGLNPLYLQSSASPGSRTVAYLQYDLMLLPGVDRGYIEESIKFVNPYYKFRFVSPNPLKYRLNNGLYYTSDTKTILISLNPKGLCTSCGLCGTTGICCPVSLWIDPSKPMTTKEFGWMIEHELDHMIGLPANPHPSDQEMSSGAYTSENITDRYMEQSKTWGAVTINSYKGSDPSQWTSWTVYI